MMMFDKIRSFEPAYFHAAQKELRKLADRYGTGFRPDNSPSGAALFVFYWKNWEVVVGYDEHGVWSMEAGPQGGDRDFATHDYLTFLEAMYLTERQLTENFSGTSVVGLKTRDPKDWSPTKQWFFELARKAWDGMPPTKRNHDTLFIALADIPESMGVELTWIDIWDVYNLFKQQIPLAKQN